MAVVKESGPALASPAGSCIDPTLPGCDDDGGDDGGMPSDEEVIEATPATIIEKWTTAVLTSSLADAFGHTSFVGIKGKMETEMKLYYLGNILAQLKDDDSYHVTVWDNIRDGLGACSVYYPPAPPGCPHLMDTHVQVGLGRECGHKITATSEHTAEDWFGGYLFSRDTDDSAAPERNQPACQPEDDDGGDDGDDGSTCLDPTLPGCDDTGGGGSGGGSGGGGGGGGCEQYTCTTWFWYDPMTGEILEIIDTECRCSSW